MFVEGGGGWSKKKRKAFEAGFREFLNHVTINSKDTGRVILGKCLFDAQERFIKAVFDGLEEDIHDFYCLKSRQLGISTVTRAFSVFWLGMHPGLTGGLVFDTDFNKKSARREIDNMIRSLPKTMRFPSIEASNREGLTLDNQSTILFFAAGIKVSKGSGTLGRSIGLSYSHSSELCSWANPEGLIAYRQSLSKVHPDRLYIYESTARGYNDWWRMWVEAKADEGQKRCIFLGWWSKPSQVIRKSHPDFRKFGLQEPTPIEQEKILQVKEWYGHQITPEQLAWIRKDSDPLASAEAGELIEYEADSYHLAEQAWTEEDSFQQSGSIFFPPEALKKATDEFVRNPDKTYSFATFAEFIDTRIHPAANPRQVQLKVWEEPEPGDAWYVVAADPAYGSSERSDRSVIQVLRCYADGCDQVAEYAWPLVGTRQFAWAILAVAGHYATNNEVRLIVELNGPGRAVWDEIIAVKRHIASGYQPKEMDDLGIRRVFANVKNYIYTRNDSMDSAKAWQWTCLSLDTKIPTPGGWTTIGHLSTMDTVFDENGWPCQVTAVSDIKIGAECYRMTFDDGSSIVADSSHLWEVSERVNKSKRRKTHVLKTVDIDPRKHRIAVAKPLNTSPHWKFQIDPYVLGVWLGDGDYNGGLISCSTEDAEEMARNLSDCGAKIGGIYRENRNPTVSSIRISGLTTVLREMGLFRNKHIPAGYLRASQEDRWQLLRGLMDTDGNITTDGQCFFHTSNPVLVPQIKELIRSLGMKAKFTERKNKKNYFNGKLVNNQTAFQFYFSAYRDNNPFRMARKRSRVEPSSVPKYGVSKYHKILSIERVDSVPVRCIQVNSTSSLFLAGEAMVPTHNTSGGNGPASKVRVLERMRDALSTDRLRIRSMDLIEEMKSVERNEEEGDEIAAGGSGKDDRVIAMALAVHCWDDRVVPTMSARRRTRESEYNRRRLTIADMSSLYMKNQFEDMLKRKQVQRRNQMRALRMSSRGYR